MTIKFGGKRSRPAKDTKDYLEVAAAICRMAAEDVRTELAPNGDTIRTYVPRPFTAAKIGRSHSGKQVVSLRLDPDVIAKYRATGPGWQARINEVLRDYALL